MRQRRAAVVGATGIAGQQALVALADHPWFEVTTLAASARTAGRPYRDAIRDKSGARLWWCREEPPDAVLDLRPLRAGRVPAPRTHALGAPALTPHAGR
jgi:N-acetyl-gamma-glutamylphosphate reductase